KHFLDALPDSGQHLTPCSEISPRTALEISHHLSRSLFVALDVGRKFPSRSVFWLSQTIFFRLLSLFICQTDVVGQIIVFVIEVKSSAVPFAHAHPDCGGSARVRWTGLTLDLGRVQFCLSRSAPSHGAVW